MKVIDIEETKKENNVQFFEIKDLPSRFKFYSKGTKILGRRLTVPEVKKLAEINSENFDFVIDSVLEQAIKGININDMRSFDKIYIILWLRANTYKETGYVIEEIKCIHCEKKFDYDFDLEKLEIIYLKDNFNSLLTFGNKTVEITFQTVSSTKELEEVKKNNKELDLEDITLSSNLGKINNKDLALLEKYNFVRDELSPSEYIRLKEYILQNEFGFKEFVNVKCTSCGGNVPVGITFCSEFFIPRYKIK